MKDKLDFSKYSAYTHNEDIQLLKKLKLKVFQDIPNGEKCYLGEAQFKPFRGARFSETTIRIKVYVVGYPAQFWTFLVETYYRDTKKLLRAVKLTTGSGCFTEYWNVLKNTFKLMDSDMLNFENLPLLKYVLKEN